VKPTPITEPKRQGVLDQLIAREPIFHRPEFGVARSDFENMTDPGFWEVGASGRCYSREFVIDTLVQRFATPHEDVWEASRFNCLELAPNTYLLTYRLIQAGKRITRRSTIWRKDADQWKIVYHQGTIVGDEAEDGDAQLVFQSRARLNSS
jgi:hypothetical protein